MATKTKTEKDETFGGPETVAPPLQVYGPAVTPSQAQAAAALEHRMMAINGTSNLVTMNATPGG